MSLLALIAVCALSVSQNFTGGTVRAHSNYLALDPGITTETKSTEPGLLNLVETEQDSSAAEIASAPYIPANNDPNYTFQWSLKTMQVPDQTQLNTLKAREVLVAILDTGIDKNHEDLEGKVLKEIDLTGNSSPGDVKGHGTHITGMIAANSNNEIGISGLAPNAKFLNVKVTDDYGKCKADIVSKGIIWAVENGAKIINISLEFNEPYPDMEIAINYAYQHNCMIIASASNQTIKPVYPAFYENCLAVTATDENDRIAGLSYNGEWIDVAAPGFSIYSTLPENSYGYKNGTSFATAQVSGLAAILYGLASDQNTGDKINDEVRKAILSGGQEISSSDIKRINFTNSISILNYNN
jgi:thermitase